MLTRDTNFDRVSTNAFLDRRRGVRGSGSFKLEANWELLGAACYDIINAGKFDQTGIGLGYGDDCLILALNCITSYTYSGNPVANHTIMLQLSLRMPGCAAVSQQVDSPGGLQYGPGVMHCAAAAKLKRWMA